jgi:hypothetical protein
MLGFWIILTVVVGGFWLIVALAWTAARIVTWRRSRR